LQPKVIGESASQVHYWITSLDYRSGYDPVFNELVSESSGFLRHDLALGARGRRDGEPSLRRKISAAQGLDQTQHMVETCPPLVASPRLGRLKNSTTLASSRRTTLSECGQLVPAEHRLKGDRNAYEEI